MKECKYCSNTYDESLNVCPSCGGIAVVTEQEKAQQAEQSQSEINVSKGSGKALRRVVLWGLAVLFVAVTTTAIVITLNNNKVYVVRDASGTQIEITQKEIKAAADLGTTYLNQGNLELAIKEFEKVPREYAGFDHVQIKLAEAQGAYRNVLFAQSDKYLADKRYADALNFIEIAKGILGTDSAVLIKEAEINDGYRVDYISKSKALSDANQFREALSTLDEATALFGNTSDIEVARNDVNDAYQKDYIASADSQLADGQFSQALNTLTVAAGIFGDTSRIVSKRSDILSAYKVDFVAKAEAMLQDEQYDKAIELLNSASKVFGDDDAQLTAQRSDVLDKYKEKFIAETDRCLQDRNYEEALSLLDSANGIWKNDAQLHAKKVEVNKAKIMVYVPTFEVSKDYAGAITYIRKELASVDNDVEVKGLLNGFVKKYEQIVLDEAEAAFSQKKYQDSISVLDDGLKVLVGDESFSSKRGEYAEYLPVSVVDLLLLKEGSNAKNNWQLKGAEYVTDIQGNVHQNAVGVGSSNRYSVWKDLSYRIYATNQQYSYLSGTIFPTIAIDADSTAELTFTILVDGKSAYSYTATRDVKADDFFINIKGCEKIEFVLDHSSAWTGSGAYAAIDNFVVGK